MAALKRLRLISLCALSVEFLRTASLAFSIIKIETDTEIYGIGEAFCYGSPLVIAKHIVEDQLVPAIIGEDPENIELLWQRMYWRNVPNGRTGLVMGCISKSLIVSMSLGSGKNKQLGFSRNCCI